MPLLDPTTELLAAVKQLNKNIELSASLTADQIRRQQRIDGAGMMAQSIKPSQIVSNMAQGLHPFHSVNEAFSPITSPMANYGAQLQSRGQEMSAAGRAQRQAASRQMGIYNKYYDAFGQDKGLLASQFTNMASQAARGYGGEQLGSLTSLAGAGIMGASRMLGPAAIGAAALTAGGMSYGGFRDLYLGAIQPSFYGAQIGQGQAGGNIGQAALGGFKPLQYGAMALGLGNPGATQAQTAGLKQGFQSLMSGLNPTSPFSVSQYQGLQNQITGAGYGATYTGAGLQMYNGAQTLSQNTGLTTQSSVQLLDTAYRRFSMTAGSASKALSGLATAATAALKSVSDMGGQVQATMISMANAGVTNGSQAIGAAQIYSSIPSVTGQTAMQVTQALGQAGLVATQYGANGNPSELTAGSLLSSFLGFPQTSGSNPSDALVQGLTMAQKFISQLTPSVGSTAATQLFYNSYLQGTGISPGQFSQMLQQLPQLKSQSNILSDTSNISKIMNNVTQGNINQQFSQQVSSLGQIKTGNSTTNAISQWSKGTSPLAGAGGLNAQLNLNWGQLLGPDNNSQNVNAILNAVINGSVQNLPSNLQWAANVVQGAINDPSGKRLNSLITQFGNNPQQTLQQMTDKAQSQTGYLSSVPKSQQAGILSNIKDIISQSAAANPNSWLSNPTTQKNLLASLQGPHAKSISSLLQLLQSSTGTNNGASVVANGVTISLNKNAARYFDLNAPSGSNLSAVSGKPTAAASGSNDRFSTITAQYLAGG